MKGHGQAMQSLLNLQGWQLFWICVAVGIIGGGAMVGLMALVNWGWEALGGGEGRG